MCCIEMVLAGAVVKEFRTNIVNFPPPKQFGVEDVRLSVQSDVCPGVIAGCVVHPSVLGHL